MALINNPAYKELSKSLGVYSAVIAMAKNAREISASLENRISSATALDFACRGEIPNPKDFPDHRLDRVKEYLNYVEDIAVQSAVIGSYELSLKGNNLVYNYGTISDKPRQARVRVIMNILWDSRPHKR